ncbi:hypothetical protein FRC06_002926 [Ceratobasidium sp. 370]|nr:hypothetical protein FRC06_002926 [Ceratobasidium sp. 370]
MVDSEKTRQQHSSELGQPLLGESAAENEKIHEFNKVEPAAKPHYRERSLGVWTLYYPVTTSWTDSIPTLGSFKKAYSFVASIPTVWKFLLESVSLAPLLFALSFITSVVTSIVPSIHLQNNSKILSLAERTLIDYNNHATVLKEFIHVFTVYLVSVVIGWGVRRLDGHIYPIIEQRVSLHFKKRILEVRSRLDLAVAENPEIKSRMDKATSYNSRAWSIIEGLAELISISIEFVGQVSVLSRMLGTREDAKLFGLVCIAPYYAMVTNHHWLRMNALYKLGTSSKFRKEVLSGGLDSFINSQYSKDMEELGDVSGDDVDAQLYRQKLFGYKDIEGVFDAIPLMANAFQNIVWRITYSGRRTWGLFDNTVALYEVLDIKPAMKDGEITYPDEEHAENKGAAIEFRRVHENILLGCPGSKNPEQDVEDASKLGGSYDFVQKLPRKFSTNIEPEQTGFSNPSLGENATEKYKKFVDAQKPTKLSGGEWQRLAGTFEHSSLALS